MRHTRKRAEEELLRAMDPPAMVIVFWPRRFRRPAWTVEFRTAVADAIAAGEAVIVEPRA